MLPAVRMEEKQNGVSSVTTDTPNSLREKKVAVPTSVGIIGENNTSFEVEVTKDGIKLHPQPTSDPLDPLNWSSLWKHTILGIVMLKYGLSVFLKA